MRLRLSVRPPLPSPPFPHDHPARVLRAAAVFASAPAFAGAGWDWVELCGGSGMPRPGWRLRDQRDLRHRSWLPAPGGGDRQEDDTSAVRHRRVRADWARKGPASLRGRNAATIIATGSHARLGRRSRPSTKPERPSVNYPLARTRSSSVIRASTCRRTSRPAPRNISCQSGRLRSVNCEQRIVS